MLLLPKLLSCEFLKISLIVRFPKNAAVNNVEIIDSVIFSQLSVNGQYASQGKLGVAVLGSHVKKEVINKVIHIYCLFSFHCFVQLQL